jgi:heme/copper-type cytochrome/quinol oxidase subunit 4
LDPITFAWEVAQTLFGLIAAVVIPVGGLWLIARRQKSRHRRDHHRPTG